MPLSENAQSQRARVRVKVKQKFSEQTQPTNSTPMLTSTSTPNQSNYGKILSYRPEATELLHPEQLDISSVAKVCRYHNVIVRGDKERMCNALGKKLFGWKYQRTPEEYLWQGVSKYFLWKIGNGPQAHDVETVNTYDFYTSIPVTDIPIAYQYHVTEDEKVYTFDIRSLTLCREVNAESFRNPYTDRPFSSDTINSIDRKQLWLTKLGYPVTFPESQRELTDEEQVEQQTIDVFSRISEHQYADNKWFSELDFEQSKQLYYELHEIWHYRLPMQATYKADMVVGGSVFPNWSRVERYRSSMHTKLKRELLHDINRLVTEGKTDDHRKSGCYMFMLGLVLVSEGAQTSHPYLFQAAYAEEDF